MLLNGNSHQNENPSLALLLLSTVSKAKLNKAVCPRSEADDGIPRGALRSTGRQLLFAREAVATRRTYSTVGGFFRTVPGQSNSAATPGAGWLFEPVEHLLLARLLRAKLAASGLLPISQHSANPRSPPRLKTTAHQLRQCLPLTRRVRCGVGPSSDSQPGAMSVMTTDWHHIALHAGLTNAAPVRTISVSPPRMPFPTGKASNDTKMGGQSWSAV
jgi:hypothetical protein